MQATVHRVEVTHCTVMEEVLTCAPYTLCLIVHANEGRPETYRHRFKSSCASIYMYSKHFVAHPLKICAKGVYCMQAKVDSDLHRSNITYLDLHSVIYDRLFTCEGRLFTCEGRLFTCEGRLFACKQQY